MVASPGTWQRRVSGSRRNPSAARTGQGASAAHSAIAVTLRAAYAAADFIGHPDGTQQPLPELHAGAVLHLRPGGYQLLPVPIGRAVLEAFLSALAVFRFATDLAPTLLPTPDPERR
jgi:hypothetical protein